MLAPAFPAAASFARTSALLVASACVAAISLGLLLGAAHADLDGERAFARASAEVLVAPPSGRPELSQESIDLALLFFGIAVPPNAERPVFDAALEDRGLTTRGAYFQKARVAIGPAAFASWGLLGSTLAHELEVHCNQNLMAIYLMDLVGLDGTGEAERQAYAHELRNGRRFGLIAADADLIADTMDFYYPDAPRSRGGPVIRRWLAKNFLRGRRF